MGVKATSENYLKLIIYLVVIVLINIAGATLFFRIDLTKNDVYTLSDASKETVASLSEPLTINVFFTKNLPAPYNNTERYVTDLLKEYAIYANKQHSYFNVKFYDVTPEEDSPVEEAAANRELAKNYGIYPHQIRVVDKDEVKFKNAYMGLVMIHGDIIEKIPSITETDGLEYKLTTAMRKLNNKISALLSLPDKIKVKLFLSSSLKVVAPLMQIKDLDGLPQKVESVVEKLRGKNYGKLAYEYLDPSLNQELASDVEKFNIMNLGWQEIPDRNIKAGKGAIGLVMEYGTKHVTIPLMQILDIPLIGRQYQMTDLTQLEETITENIDGLIDINENIGYLADHGTLPLNSPPQMGPFQQQDPNSISSFKTLASQNYTFKEINLKEKDIPKGLNCLIIARPKEKFSDYELFQIDQHLMNGNSIAFFMDVFDEVAPQQNNFSGFNQGPSYMPIDSGLEKLFTHYGIRMKKSFVLDENCYKQQSPQQFGGGERMIYFAPLIKSENINEKLDFMRNIKGLVTLKISPLELDAETIAKNGITAHKLFASSAKSWEMKGRINLNPMFIRPPDKDEDKSSMPLAYLLEGEFPSYFDGKTIPVRKKESEEKEDKENAEDKKKEDAKSDDAPQLTDKIKGESGFIAKGLPGKIFIIASSEIIKDNMIDKEGASPNATFIMNIIDSLNNRDALALMRSKNQNFNPLDETEPSTRTYVKALNIAGLPVLVTVFGLLVLFRRQYRKNQIKMMFEK